MQLQLASFLLKRCFKSLSNSNSFFFLIFDVLARMFQSVFTLFDVVLIIPECVHFCKLASTWGLLSCCTKGCCIGCKPGKRWPHFPNLELSHTIPLLFVSPALLQRLEMFHGVAPRVCLGIPKFVGSIASFFRGWKIHLFIYRLNVCIMQNSAYLWTWQRFFYIGRLFIVNLQK